MRALALILLAATPAVADMRDLSAGDILGPEDHAHLFAEHCFTGDPSTVAGAAARIAEIGLYEVAEPGGQTAFYVTPDGLATLAVNAASGEASCEMGLTPGAADFGPALEEAFAAHIALRSDAATRETLAAGTVWTWEIEGRDARAELLQADDAYLLRYTIRD